MPVRTKILKNRMPQLKGAMRRAAVKIANESAEEVLAISQQLVPVDSGELKASGHVENYAGSEDAKAVVYDAPHAVFVELGTENSPPQPFLAPAYEAVRSRMNRRFGQIEAGLGKEVGR